MKILKKLAAVAAAMVAVAAAGCGSEISEKTDMPARVSTAESSGESRANETMPDSSAPEVSAVTEMTSSAEGAVTPASDSSSADSSSSDTDSNSDEKSDSGITTEKKVLSAVNDTPNRVTLVCVGDNLIHDNIYNEAWKRGGDHYDFFPVYEHTEKYFKDADLKILNQETLVTDKYGPSSFPCFATPTADGDCVVDKLGVNVISMSNNHVLDMGADGLISSLDYWDSKPVVHYGAYRNDKDSRTIRTTEINGITFAFLGYMEHTNGFFLDPDADNGKVVYLNELDRIEEEIKAADKAADVVVVSAHFGTEVLNAINDQQATLAPKFVEWGADLIIGTQAHACSTCGYIDKPDGGQAFCYYGLGNFVSTMYYPNSPIGILGKMNVVKDPTSGKVTFENVKAIPLVQHYEADSFYSDWYNCATYPYAEYTDELFARNYSDGFNRQEAENCLSYIPQEFLSIE
ncbi:MULTISPECIES: CapA family protein [unclassified Ruminococcus]|uniref:CapA family protein n=1 Tax=unclassified Ruminococcus TaxID=2608920 RepID=UPI001FA75D12|nr:MULTISPECIES: CapA family protein [unclassified Ruminococcus]